MTVCTVRRKGRLMTLFSINATVTGTITPRIAFIPAINTVFQTTCQMVGISKTKIKFSNPTQGEPKMPLPGRTRWKAMTMPTIGR